MKSVHWIFMTQGGMHTSLKAKLQSIVKTSLTYNAANTSFYELTLF